jgi:hypothetical protein
MSCFGPAGVSNSRLAKRKCTKRSRNLVHLGVLGHFLERERSWRGGDCTPQRVGLLHETELDAAAAAGGNRHAGSRGIQVLPPRPPHVSVDRRLRIPAAFLDPSVLRPGLTHVFTLAWGCGGIPAVLIDPSAVLPWSGRSGSL